MQIKGTKSGLLLHLYERPLTSAVAELRDRLSSLPGFYKGSRAVLMLGAQPAQADELAAVIATLEQFGIAADGAVCDSDSVAGLARSAGLRIVAASVAAAPRIRDDRTKPVAQRTPDERAERPHHHERRRKHGNGHVAAAIQRSLETMLFYKGTLRSGQRLNAAGNIVVLGDVNPGAELVATGDIVVWGALRGVAHAGAEGDDDASVYALRLEPTQLRISRFVAVAPDDRRRRRPGPEAARIRGGRIIIDREI